MRAIGKGKRHDQRGSVHYVSLCTRGARHIAEFKAKYPGIKTGTSCISFKITDPVPVAAIKKVVKHAIEHPK